jgi:hypothetical protein
VLTAHEPYPAIAVDRHWNLIASNGALGPMLEGVAPDLPPPRRSPCGCGWRRSRGTTAASWRSSARSRHSGPRSTSPSRSCRWRPSSPPTPPPPRVLISAGARPARAPGSPSRRRWR